MDHGWLDVGVNPPVEVLKILLFAQEMQKFRAEVEEEEKLSDVVLVATRCTSVRARKFRWPKLLSIC